MFLNTFEEGLNLFFLDDPEIRLGDDYNYNSQNSEILRHAPLYYSPLIH